GAPVVSAGIRPCTPLKPWAVSTKYAGVFEEHPMPDIFARRCGSTPSSYRALIMWLVIELWPQPAHSVVAAPLYASRASPARLTVVLMRAPPLCPSGVR